MKLAKLPQTTPMTFTDLRDEADRLMDRFFLPGLFSPTTRLREDLWTPTLDFSETEKDYVVRLEAPGVAKEDIEVNLDGQVLTLRGERISAKERKDEKFFWREREEGRFLRTVNLPTPVDGAKVAATMNHGILTVRLPKMEPSTSTHIPVK
jgi:HSP20 family protein